jgi:peptidyl-tRNA hydrolase, PTH1 family
MKLVVGLGNPGFLYARNRHNIGFMCVNHLARMQRIHFDRRQGYARTGLGNIGPQRVVLARPQIFMNSSGDSVHRLVQLLKITPADLVVIHDDLDLPLGKVRLRLGGSSGGHKGIESIIARLGSRDFYRARVGIGRPEIDGDRPAEKEEAVIGYVLSDFTGEERKRVEAVLPEVSGAVVSLLTEGLAAAMNRYN